MLRNGALGNAICEEQLKHHWTNGPIEFDGIYFVGPYAARLQTNQPRHLDFRSINTIRKATPTRLANKKATKNSTMAR